MAYWLSKAHSRLNELMSVIEEGGLDQPSLKTMTKKLDTSLQPVTGRWNRVVRLAQRLNGELRSEVWTDIHGLEEEVLRALKTKYSDGSKIDIFHREAELHADRLTRSDAKEMLKKFHDAVESRKWEVAMDEAIVAVSRAHKRSQDLHNTERNTSRGLVGISLALVAVAVVIGEMQFKTPDDFVVPRPDGTNVGAGSLFTYIAAFGALGGLLSALPSLYLAKRVKNTSWYDPRPVLTLHKATWGIVAGVLGTMIVGTNALVGDYSSLPAALIIATVFGYSQQALTRFVDNRASSLTDSSEDSTKE